MGEKAIAHKSVSFDCGKASQFGAALKGAICTYKMAREINRNTPKTVSISAAKSAHFIGGVGNSSSK
jgi:hypothetical protein